MVELGLGGAQMQKSEKWSALNSKFRRQKEHTRNAIDNTGLAHRVLVLRS